MADRQQSHELTEEDVEVQRTQLRHALQQAQSFHLNASSPQYDRDADVRLYTRNTPSRSSFGTFDQDSPLSLREKYSLSRTRSAARGPVTDHRGLGTLAPYVLPGMLKRASMGVPNEDQLSALRMLANEELRSFAADSARQLGRSASQQADRQSPGSRLMSCANSCANWQIGAMQQLL